MTDYYPNWFDRNKFEKKLAIIGSNKFNYRNKIGKFKYSNIKDLVNNIRDNTISEIFGKWWNLDEIIDKSKSFEDQIKSVRKVENIGEYYFSNNFGDKGLKFKYFKLKLAHLTNNIDEKLFEQIFGHKFQTVNKLINTTNKEEMDSFNNFVIQPSEGHVDVTDAINVILKFNEEI